MIIQFLPDEYQSQDEMENGIITNAKKKNHSILNTPQSTLSTSTFQNQEQRLPIFLLKNNQ